MDHNEITTAITGVKAKVTETEWQQRIMECRSSGMTVKEWCEANGITTGSYYSNLRKLREKTLQSASGTPIVELPRPIMESNHGIVLESGNIRITLPENISPEMLITVIQTLKLC